MSPVDAALIVLGWGFATFLVFRTIQDIVWRMRMKRNERRLRAAGIVPQGATLAHGIAIHKKTGKIESHEWPNLAWYKRLR